MVNQDKFIIHGSKEQQLNNFRTFIKENEEIIKKAYEKKAEKDKKEFSIFSKK